MIVHMGGEAVSKEVRIVWRQPLRFCDVLYYPADAANLETFCAPMWSDTEKQRVCLNFHNRQQLERATTPGLQLVHIPRKSPCTLFSSSSD